MWLFSCSGRRLSQKSLAPPAKQGWFSYFSTGSKKPFDFRSIQLSVVGSWQLCRKDNHQR